MKRAPRAHRPAPHGLRSARTSARPADGPPTTDASPDRADAIRADPVGAFPAPTPAGAIAAPSIVLAVVLLLCAVGLAVLGTGRPGVPAPLALLPAAAVATAAVLAPLALRLLVVRPALRLRRAVTPSGSGPRTPPPRSRLREFDRIALGLRGSARPPARGSATAAVVAVLGLVAAALAGVLAAVVTLTPAPPAALVAETRRSTAAAAGEVRHTLQDGLAGLRSVAAAADPAALEAAATTALTARAVFRSVHAVDASGAVLARAGAAPAVTGPPPEPGVRQIATGGAAPVVVAVAPVGATGAVLVAEYDVRELNTTLAGAGVPARVLDADLRTVLSSGGYLAFAPLVDAALADVASAAHQTGAGSLSGQVGGRPAVVAAHRIGVADEAAALGWVVLSHRGLTAAGFAADPAARGSAVVLAVAIAAVLAVLAWTWHSALRPLRRLAGPAAAAGASRRPWRDRPGQVIPGPVPVQRLDEIGAVTAAVNRLLQRARSAAEPTTVFPKVVDEPEPPRRAARADVGETRRLRRVLAAVRR